MKKCVIVAGLSVLLSTLLGCASVPMEMHVDDAIPPTDCYPIGSF